MNYSLLSTFSGLFSNKIYRHRVSTNGDRVAEQLFEDLYNLGRSAKFMERVDSGLSVINTKNRRHGISARRGDGSFGEIVPGEIVIDEPDYSIKRGSIATIEIGVEVKILAKAMIKQIDRVISDLGKQVGHFRSRGGNPVTVGIVGINWAEEYCSVEGDRFWPTDGRRYKHPCQEAEAAEQRLLELAAPQFDEFIILRFRASNIDPYPFSWKSLTGTEVDYGASLARIGAEYQLRV